MAVEARNLGKVYGPVRAVDDLSFRVEPGKVTGFLGPNGSGKSTTMRLMLGLDRGTGTTLWDGKPLSEAANPTALVGAHLDAKAFHPTRTARDHLRLLAAAAGISDSRVDEVVDLMGLQSVAKKRPKGFSLGMGQRLGLAAAILAEPTVLLLDEPANGLDPQSIQWLRAFLRDYAEKGKAVFVSSHLLSEMELMADHVVVIAAGKLVADADMADFVALSTRNDVLVRTPQMQELLEALQLAGLSASTSPEGISVLGATTEQIGDIAFTAGVRIHELTLRSASLEEAFLELTSDKQQYATGGRDGGAAPAANGGAA